MRIPLTVLSVTALAVCAFLSAETKEEAVKVRLKLIDAETGKGISGIIRVSAKAGDRPLTLSGLYDRLHGLQKSEQVAGWYVIPADGAITTLPRAVLKLEALSGLETPLTRQDTDLTGKAREEITVKLPFLFRPDKAGLAAGNTHLHLRNMTLAEADDYLKQIPAADGIKVMFISYLERHKDDATYITNRYPVGNLNKLDGPGIVFNNGEEHRHNFEAFGQGYGHVMLLNIRELVKPVSLGPGITGAGFDDTPLAVGLDDARKQGGTIIWCHNTNGYEATSNALAGRLDAFNVFDGSRSGNYDDRYYRFLNIGMRLPISTGTDWFMYDFSRVYARMRDQQVTPKTWLDALKAGRSMATNGPLLKLSVDGKDIGDMINLEKPRTVAIEASAIGRHNFGQLALVHNGKVIKTQPAASKDGGYTAQLSLKLPIDEPGWLAVRIDTQTKNEFDQLLFAHSSPVYIDLAGKRVFNLEAARALLKQLEEARADIRAKGKFSSPDTQEKLLAIYEQAGKELAKQINQRGQ
jgi:hypothetical protein